MNTQQILPVLDLAVLQEKANEFAMKGATESLKEFYSGYNSPYRKAIDEDLKQKGLSSSMDLPDVIGLINESLSNEIDRIANESIAKTFIPHVKRFLTREESEINFSDVLKEFIKCNENKDHDNFYVDVQKHERHEWLNVEISAEDSKYILTLHEDWDTRKLDGKAKKYQILSLPYETSSNQKMVLSVDGAKLELPFTRDILKDEFLAYVARIILCNSKITIDTKEFDYDMFPRDECHCD